MDAGDGAAAGEIRETTAGTALLLLCVSWVLSKGVHIRVLHGPGLGPRAGPARSPWAGPGQDSMIFCGPGRVRA